MDGHTYASYFLRPEALAHTRYEALRAVCVDELSLREAAELFDVSYGTIRNWFSEFCRMQDAGQSPPFSPLPSVDDL
jgi:Homeodomain-like domain